MTKSRREIEALVEALDDEPIADAEARGVVKALGIDVKELAGRLRANVAEADARDRQVRFAEASQAYAEEIERLERRELEAAPTRDLQIATMKALLNRAPAHAVAMHFHKYESVTDEELAELVRALRHLLGKDGDPE
jgi:hypothetical protein